MISLPASAVPVTVYENFYRNEDEDHDNDGVSDGTVRVYTRTDDVNLACLMRYCLERRKCRRS